MKEKIINPNDALIQKFSDSLNANWSKLEYYLDTPLLWPEMQYLKDEIIHCLLINSNQAAITLTNHFLEKTLKLGLIYYTTGGKRVHFGDQLKTYEDAIEKYDAQLLFNNIESCFNKGLISEDVKSKLQEYRINIRNAFSHAEAGKTFKDITAPSIIIPTDNPNKYTIHSHPISSMPYIQGVAQQILAEQLAFPYFVFVYQTLRIIEKNVEDISKSAN